MKTDNEKPATSPLIQSSGSLLDECLEMLAEVLESTVDASTYPDGQNLDCKLRARIAVVLTKAENIEDVDARLSN